MNNIIIFLYCVTAGMLMLELAFVLRQAMNDNYLRRNDSLTVTFARKISFAMGFFFLPLTVLSRRFWLFPILNIDPLVSLGIGVVLIGLMDIAIVILSVSVASMYYRAPPAAPHAHGYAAPRGTVGRNP
jgi:hypothetical protein